MMRIGFTSNLGDTCPLLLLVIAMLKASPQTPTTARRRDEQEALTLNLMQNQSIPIYKWKDFIRKRPGMFIGDLHFTGFKQMLAYLFEEVLSDCLENPIFEIDFYAENRLTIRISNINTKKFLLRLDSIQSTEDSITRLGLGVIIALSADISIAINDRPTLIVLYGQKGNFETVASTSQEKQNNVIIGYTLDKDIFKDLGLVYEHINGFLRQFALLNPHLKIISRDKSTNELQRNVFYYPTGILSELDYFISQNPHRVSSIRVDIDAQFNKYSYKIGILYSGIWLNTSLIKTYAGNIETYLGGSLHDGILEGLILATKKIAQKENIAIVINKTLIRKELIVIAAVQGDDFVFEGSVKRKLGMPQIKKDVSKLVSERMTAYFESIPKATESILSKFKRGE